MMDQKTKQFIKYANKNVLYLDSTNEEDNESNHSEGEEADDESYMHQNQMLDDKYEEEDNIDQHKVTDTSYPLHLRHMQDDS